MLRHQSGQPFGRTFTTSLNYGNNVRVLAEPIGTRRMDNITILDVRVEKGFGLSGGRRVAAFVDVFNMLQRQPGAEHELVLRAVLPAATQYRRAADRARRCEAGVVSPGRCLRQAELLAKSCESGIAPKQSHFWKRQ